MQSTIPANQNCRKSNKAVEESDKFRHAGHRDYLGSPEPDDRTCTKCYQQQHEAGGSAFIPLAREGEPYGGRHRDCHSGDAVADTGPTGLMLAETCEAHDE